MRRWIATLILITTAITITPGCVKKRFNSRPVLKGKQPRDSYSPSIDKGNGPAYVNDTDVSRLILTMAAKLKYNKHLVLEDSTVYFDQKINRIRLDFTSQDSIEIWEARALLVDLVEELLGKINSNAQIYPYLGKTPFAPGDLEVYITFTSFYNRHIDLQTVGLITLRKGLAHYIMTDGIDRETPCWHQRTETYNQSRNFTQFHREGELLYRPKPIEKVQHLSDERLYEMRQFP